MIARFNIYNMITSYKIFEAKNYSSLYHIIDLNKLAFIIDNNVLKSYHFSKISTTRNKMMNGYTGDSPVSIFKLELDAEKLSQNYKIKPFAEKYTEIGLDSRKIKRFQEWEEQIQTNEIKNIDRYVKKLIIIKSNVERLKDSGWFDTDGGNFRGQRMTFPEYFRTYLPKVKFPIYVQEGAVIKKDDEWIDSIKNYELKIINHAYALAYKGCRRVKDEYYCVDHVNFVDDKNKIELKRGDSLVIGYKYNDLYLSKDLDKIKKQMLELDYELEDTEEFRGMELRILDFIYESEDVIKESNEFVYVNKAKLDGMTLASWIKKKEKALV